jgi:hypothetical protein
VAGDGDGVKFPPGTNNPRTKCEKFKSKPTGADTVCVGEEEDVEQRRRRQEEGKDARAKRRKTRPDAMS